MDYQGNSKKSKEADSSVPKNVVPLPPKNIERVVVTDVIVQKRGISRKFKDLFIEADIKSSTRYVIAEVLLPAARNMVVDAVTKGMERLVYGESVQRRRNFGPGPRITYNNPVNREHRGFGGSPLRDASRHAPPVSPEPRSSRQHSRDLIFSSREEGDLVLERMNDIIDTYEIVSMADLNELVGIPTTHVDNKWGWTNLSDVQIRQIREGYLIDFPPAEPIN